MAQGGIGYRKRQYLEAKAAKAAEEASVSPTETPTAPAEQPSMASVLAMMATLIEKMGNGQKSDTEQAAALKQIELMEQLVVKTRPENVDYPRISAYSYPEGDVARPKPALKCQILWCGYELHATTMTPEEIEALNTLVPGEYRVTKADGTSIPFRVQGKNSDTLDAQGRPQLESLSIWFPCKGDQRQSHMSLLSYCHQAMGHAIPSTADLLAELARLKQELAAAKPGVIGSL